MATLMEELRFRPQDSRFYNRRIAKVEYSTGGAEKWAGKQIERDGRHEVKTLRTVHTLDTVKVRIVCTLNEWERNSIAFVTHSAKAAQAYCDRAGIVLMGV